MKSAEFNYAERCPDLLRIRLRVHAQMIASACFLCVELCVRMKNVAGRTVRCPAYDNSQGPFGWRDQGSNASRKKQKRAESRVQSKQEAQLKKKVQSSRASSPNENFNALMPYPVVLL
eukprot:1388112-Pleurochrysis_carterae.AAC.3